MSASNNWPKEKNIQNSVKLASWWLTVWIHTLIIHFLFWEREMSQKENLEDYLLLPPLHTNLLCVNQYTLCSRLFSDDQSIQTLIFFLVQNICWYQSNMNNQIWLIRRRWFIFFNSSSESLAVITLFYHDVFEYVNIVTAIVYTRGLVMWKLHLT